MADYAAKPSPNTIRAIASDEAARAGILLSEIMSPYMARLYSRPRKRAFVRIIRETGCTPYGLAQVWGCDPQSVRRAWIEAETVRLSMRLFVKVAA